MESFSKIQCKGETIPPINQFSAFKFSVEIDGTTIGYFKNVSGLNVELDVLESRSSDDKFPKKRPGRARFDDITLQKGYIVSKDLKQWWNHTLEGNLTRKTLTIHLSNNGIVVQTWKCFDCWPRRWNVFTQISLEDNVLTDEISFVTESIKLS